MSRSPHALLMICATVPLLAGCGTLFRHSAQKMPEIRVAGAGSVTEAENFAAGQLDAGRTALAHEQYGQAIMAFRNARLVPEHAAAAYNGMAVAYARIGRPDLAERYFQQAIAEDPGDRRYQANLRHLYTRGSQMAAKAQSAEAAMARETPASKVLASTTSRATIRIELPQSRVIRISENAVRISTPTVSEANKAASPTLRAAKTVAPPAHSTRDRSPGYPLRVSLSDQPVAVSVRTAAVERAASYPVRVSLGRVGRSE